MLYQHFTDKQESYSLSGWLGREKRAEEFPFRFFTDAFPGVGNREGMSIGIDCQVNVSVIADTLHRIFDDIEQHLVEQYRIQLQHRHISVRREMQPDVPVIAHHFHKPF